MNDSRRVAEEHFDRAIESFASGRLEQAADEYRAAVEADSSFTDALHGLVRTLQDLNRYDEAIDVARRLAELDPDAVLPHTSLSILYQKKGMIPEAEAEAN